MADPIQLSIRREKALNDLREIVDMVVKDFELDVDTEALNQTKIAATPEGQTAFLEALCEIAKSLIAHLHERYKESNTHIIEADDKQDNLEDFEDLNDFDELDNPEDQDGQKLFDSDTVESIGDQVSQVKSKRGRKPRQ